MGGSAWVLLDSIHGINRAVFPFWMFSKEHLFHWTFQLLEVAHTPSQVAPPPSLKPAQLHLSDTSQSSVSIFLFKGPLACTGYTCIIQDIQHGSCWKVSSTCDHVHLHVTMYIYMLPCKVTSSQVPEIKTWKPLGGHCCFFVCLFVCFYHVSTLE